MGYNLIHNLKEYRQKYKKVMDPQTVDPKTQTTTLNTSSLNAHFSVDYEPAADHFR